MKQLTKRITIFHALKHTIMTGKIMKDPNYCITSIQNQTLLKYNIGATYFGSFVVFQHQQNRAFNRLITEKQKKIK